MRCKGWGASGLCFHTSSARSEAAG